jgi:hypothetical protein
MQKSSRTMQMSLNLLPNFCLIISHSASIIFLLHFIQQCSFHAQVKLERERNCLLLYSKLNKANSHPILYPVVEEEDGTSISYAIPGTS